MGSGFKEKLASALSLENAKLWQAEQDKALWVIDNILDPNDVFVNDGRIDWVELKFEELLEGAK
jgi:hypothetical protein